MIFLPSYTHMTYIVTIASSKQRLTEALVVIQQNCQLGASGGRELTSEKWTKVWSEDYTALQPWSLMVTMLIELHDFIYHIYINAWKLFPGP